MKTFAQCLALFAFKFDQPMRDAILVEEIIELMSIARIAVCQNTHSREFAIAAEPTPSHDQGIDDCFAHGRNFRQSAPKFCGRNVEYLCLVRCDSGRTEDRVPWSMDTSPMKSRARAVARLYSVPSRVSKASNSPRKTIANPRSRCPALKSTSPRFITRRSAKGSRSES